MNIRTNCKNPELLFFKIVCFTFLITSCIKRKFLTYRVLTVNQRFADQTMGKLKLSRFELMSHCAFNFFWIYDKLCSGRVFRGGGVGNGAVDAFSLKDLNPCRPKGSPFVLILKMDPKKFLNMPLEPILTFFWEEGGGELVLKKTAIVCHCLVKIFQIFQKCLKKHFFWPVFSIFFTLGDF